jgi:hypothetical protein
MIIKFKLNLIREFIIVDRVDDRLNGFKETDPNLFFDVPNRIYAAAPLIVRELTRQLIFDETELEAAVVGNVVEEQEI